MILLKPLSSVALLALVSASVAFQNCPYLGPDFSKPTNLIGSEPLQHAFVKLTSSLDCIIQTNKSSYGPLNASSNSFSIQIFSAQNPTALFQSYHTATNLASLNSSGVTAVDAHTVYRIGSLTKLLTIYTFLLQSGDKHFNQPVTKYVPELAAISTNMSTNVLNNVMWTDVTLGELASHLGGIGRDGSALGELELSSGFDPTLYGLPPLNSSDVPSCSIDPLCTRAAFFSDIGQRHPVFPTSTTPAYSNEAFQILSYALENITGKDFPSMMKESIFQPLNLTDTTYTVPDDSVGVIPGDIMSTFWAIDAGDESPAGGVYSSASDLSTIGRSILESSLLLPAETRRWMKPVSHTADPLQSVGLPWEIQRIELQNPFRITDAYTKAGDLGSYSSYLILLPDYDLGISILAAGDEAAATVAILGDLVGDIVIPAAEATSRQQAQAAYSGYYSNIGLNSSLTITENSASLGLRITQWVSNGVDMMPVMASLIPATEPVINIYPTQLKRTSSDGFTTESFRAVFGDGAVPMVVGSFEQNCISWEAVDNFHYERVSLDEFLFNIGPTGEVESIVPRAFKATLNKVQE